MPALASSGAAPAPGGSGRLGAIAARLPSGRRRLALAWAAAALVGLVALGGSSGISGDEAAVVSAARPELFPARAGAAPPVIAPLAPLLARASDATLGRIGIPHRIALRLPAALAGAALVLLLALLGHDLAGPAGAALAPALYLLVPRHLQAGAVAMPDGLSAALALGAVWAYRAAGRTRRRLGASLAAGLLVGLAIAARLDAWVLLPALAVHALAARALRRRAARDLARAPDAAPAGSADDDGDAPATDPAAVAIEAHLHGVPLALASVCLLGPVVAVALWPSLLAHPLRVLRDAAHPASILPYLGARLAGPRPPPGYPLVVTALSVPVAVLLAYAGGAVHAAARLLRGRRAGFREDAADDVLLLVCAAAPVIAAQLGLAPLVGGVRPWLLAFPFLAVLGARAMLASARTAWPDRARPLAAAVAVVVLYPALRASIHAWPALGASWNELAGGAPGAASLGMQRQEPGQAARAILPEVAARARPGARVLFVGVAPAAAAVYLADGTLPPDLTVVDDPDHADLAIAALDGGSRDREYEVWSALRTAQPVAGVFLDEVPLVLVYARAGAWR